MCEFKLEFQKSFYNLLQDYSICVEFYLGNELVSLGNETYFF